MGFRGYYQIICKNGHFSEVGLYENRMCHICGENAGLQNLVDDTNGELEGIIPYNVLDSKLLIQPEKNEYCNFGNNHLTEPAIYRIPSHDELSELRHFLADGEFHLLSEFSNEKEEKDEDEF